MKKTVICVILILLCLICAMLFYTSAQEVKKEEESSTVQESTAPVSNLPVFSIEQDGVFLSENICEPSLRVQYALYKEKTSDKVYVSVEVYLDTSEHISTKTVGTVSINGEENAFSVAQITKDSTLLCSAQNDFSFAEGKEISVGATLQFPIHSSEGYIASELHVDGTIVLSEKDVPNQAQIDFTPLCKYPSLPSGDGIVSLASVLQYLGYECDAGELCDLYLEKGPVGYTDYHKANVGNPRSAYNSYGCLPSVLVKSANRFCNVSGAHHQAVDLTGYDVNYLLSLVANGTPVIVWGNENYEVESQVYKIWVVDGVMLPLKSNGAVCVLCGYQKEQSTVTLAYPNGTTQTVDASLFFSRFLQNGSYAMCVK